MSFSKKLHFLKEFISGKKGCLLFDFAQAVLCTVGLTSSKEKLYLREVHCIERSVMSGYL